MMQVKLVAAAAVVLVAFASSIVANHPGPESRDIGLTTCEDIYGVMPYPRVITNITLIGTSPLRVRVHLLARSPSRSIPFSIEGMVCHIGFNQNAANAACRSLNFNKAVYVTNVDWQAPATGSGQECIMDTGAYKSVIPCEYVLHQINCPVWVTSLIQCTFPPLFTQPATCNRYTHVGLICT